MARKPPPDWVIEKRRRRDAASLSGQNPPSGPPMPRATCHFVVDGAAADLVFDPPATIEEFDIVSASFCVRFNIPFRSLYADAPMPIVGRELSALPEMGALAEIGSHQRFADCIGPDEGELFTPEQIQIDAQAETLVPQGSPGDILASPQQSDMFA